MPNAKMTEAQMVGLVRNALLVAGTEMGESGDHWPVIKSTVHSIMKDWEHLQVERNVSAELKVHFGNWLKEFEAAINKECSGDMKVQMEKGLRELQEIYAAQFTAIDPKNIVLSDDDLPAHIKRAEAIIDSLEGQND